MKILLVCSGGMSSAIVAKALQEAGTKEGVLDEKEAVPVKDKKVQLEERTIKVFVGRQAKE